MRPMLFSAVGFVCAVLLCFSAMGDLVPDLDSVQGIAQYEGSDSGKVLLRKNGFVVVPRYYHRIFGPYLRTELPPYVTADSVHRSFHVIFEEDLQRCEEKAREYMGTVVASMLAAVEKAPDSEESALALDYFRGADCLLHGKRAPENAGVVEEELALIHAASGIADSPLFGYPLDYSQFVPRGFYTKTPTLKSYFRAMSWFGNAAFRLKSDLETRAAMLIAGQFAEHADARDTWGCLNALYTGLLFECDDLTVDEYARLLETGLSELAAFQEAAWALRDPKYCDMALPPGAEPVRETKGMRFMGKRFLPDGAVFAAVTHPEVPERYFPTVLDVLAANGSAGARTHLENASAAALHLAALDSAGKMLAADKSHYADSPYMQTLGVMAALTAPPIDAAAAFAKTDAYADKNLMTAAAVWASTRHAWILHGKRNATAMCMFPDNPIPGYIEPNPVFFERMAQLNTTTLRLLRDFGNELGQPFEKLAPFLEALSGMLQDQLEGQPPSGEARSFFEHYGDTLVELQGHRTNVPYDGAFDWMALVADVATESVLGQCLEVATGGAMPIYAVVELDGVRQLLIGGVYSFYEFKQPIAERLTDEAWHAMLDDGGIPSLPLWTSSFMADHADVEALVQRLENGEAVPEAKYIDDSRLDAFLREAIHREGAMDFAGAPYREDTLLSIAAKKIPSELKPLLIERLRTIPIPDYEWRLTLRYTSLAAEGETPSEETDFKNSTEILDWMRHLLGPCLSVEDLNTLWEIIEAGEPNRAAVVLQVTIDMKDKAAEQFWLRAYERLEDPATRMWVGSGSLGYLMSKDVTPGLLAQLRGSAAENWDHILFLLAMVWRPEPERCPCPCFYDRLDAGASMAEIEAWKKDLREAVTASLNEEAPPRCADANDALRLGGSAAHITRLAADLEIDGFPALAARNVANHRWSARYLISGMNLLSPDQAVPVLQALLPIVNNREKQEAIEMLGQTNSRLAIPVLIPYLDDKSRARSDKPRLSSYACEALDRILADVVMEHSAYHLWEYEQNPELFDKHREELLELTAEYIEEAQE